MKHMLKMCRLPLSRFGFENEVILPLLFMHKSGTEIICRSYSSSHTRNKRKIISYYDILGVKPSASREEIKDAFIKRSKECHPDTNPEDPTLHAKFAQINEAYSKVNKNKMVPGNKVTGDQTCYETGEDYWKPDDYHDREHYEYMSSREYYHYTKQSMAEHDQKVHSYHHSHNCDANKSYSYMGLVVALVATCLMGLSIKYLSWKKSQNSDQIRERESAYFKALAEKIQEDRRKFLEERKKRRYKVFDFSGNDPETSVDKLEICSTEKKKDDPPGNRSTAELPFGFSPTKHR